ncbi:MAG: carbon-nitrogen family hydrolase [Bacillota bacterium]|jgi:omega-amidase
MKAAVLQFNIQSGDVEGNRKKASDLIIQAAEQGAELVLLPELWNCGYALDRLSELAETSRGSSIRMLQKLAKKNNLFIIGGSIGEKKDGKFFNTSFAINQEGNIVSKYRKVHLFSLGLEEHKYFSPGGEWVLTQTPWFTVGMMVCYDLRFPEFARNLVMRGARLLTIPAQWPTSRETDWRILCQARAIENQCFVMSANRTGTDINGLEYNGASLIINPWGRIVVDAKDKSGAFVAELDLSMLEEENQKIDVFGDRRAILDEIDDSQI